MNIFSEAPPATSPAGGGPGGDPISSATFAASIREAAEALVAAASPRRGLVTVPLPPAALHTIATDPYRLLQNAEAISFQQPARGLHVFGVGAARTIAGHGPIAAATGAILDTRVTVSPRVAATARPRYYGGGRFDPTTAKRDPRWDAFGDWQFRMPAFLLACADGEAAGSLTWDVAASDDSRELANKLLDVLRVSAASAGPGPLVNRGLGASEWQDAVASAVADINAGSYDKVVLARSETVKLPGAADVPAVLSRLEQRYPGCYVFSFSSEGRTWLGASPELLVSLRDGLARAASLAGSRPRGSSDEEDCRLGSELMANSKERAEHGFVVDATRAALEPIATGIDVPSAPGLMKMQNIQHLYTPIRCEVRPGTNVLDLVSRMHPTPAVGAWPREAAFDALPRLERMDRGWYAGPIGWIDLEGDGEFAVALRSALVSGREATLYAGAGIVAGSVPADEIEETRLKLRPLADALQES